MGSATNACTAARRGSPWGSSALASAASTRTPKSCSSQRSSATVTVHNLVDKTDVQVPADKYGSFGHLLAAGQRVEIVGTVTRDTDTPVRAETISAG